MSKPTPITETMNISEVQTQLSGLVNEVNRLEKRIIIEQAGTPVAAVVSFSALERLNRFEQNWNDQFAILDQLRKAFADLPADQIEQDVTALVRHMRNEDDASSRETEARISSRQSA